jgi:hypothetical protein
MSSIHQFKSHRSSQRQRSVVTKKIVVPKQVIAIKTTVQQRWNNNIKHNGETIESILYKHHDHGGGGGKQQQRAVAHSK